MSKVELAALAASAIASGSVPINRLPAGYASGEPVKKPAEPRFSRQVDRVVVDHLGREHVRNSDGEWLS